MSTAAQMAPSAQASLLDAVRAAEGTVGLIFHVKHLAVVDLSVPAEWMAIATELDGKVLSMAICSDGAAVRVAGRGFAMACRVKSPGISVGVFRTEEEGRLWLGLRAAGVIAVSPTVE
jgi:hypothetical protein